MPEWPKGAVCKIAGVCLQRFESSSRHHRPEMTERSPIYIRALTVDDAPGLLAVRLANRAFLEPFEPPRKDEFFTLRAQTDQIRAGAVQWKADQGYAFGVFEEPTDQLVGRVALSNIVRGAWHNATLGYFITQDRGGRGFATEAVRQAVTFGFQDARLHRVQAGVMPRNKASIRVLEKNGFRHEGSSLRYLNINGVWEDHELFAVTVEEWAP
jgi:[ribosomal protein S5]-alanine N-acetyltransferase